MKRWKCPECNTLNCSCTRTCMLCKTKMPEHPEWVEYVSHNPR